MARLRGTDSAKVIQVIVTESLRGEGTEKDLCRIVTQYWDFNGNLLAENDPCVSEQVQTIPHKLYRGDVMKHRNIVVIDGEEVDVCNLPEEERSRLAREWNRRALEEVGYEEIGTA